MLQYVIFFRKYHSVLILTKSEWNCVTFEKQIYQFKTINIRIICSEKYYLLLFYNFNNYVTCYFT